MMGNTTNSRTGMLRFWQQKYVFPYAYVFSSEFGPGRPGRSSPESSPCLTDACMVGI